MSVFNCRYRNTAHENLTNITYIFGTFQNLLSNIIKPVNPYAIRVNFFVSATYSDFSIGLWEVYEKFVMTLILRENFVLSISLIAYNKSSTKTLLKSCKCIYQLLIILLCINTTALRHPNDVSGVGFGSTYFVLCTQCFAYGIAIFFVIRCVFFINLINIY